MCMSSKIVWTLGGICLLSSLFAEDKEIAYGSPSPSFGKVQMADVVKRLEAAEKKVDQISEKKESNGWGIKNPPPRGCMGGQEGIFTQLSFLYWKPFNHGFPFAAIYKNLSITPEGQLSYGTQKTLEMGFRLRPGFRGGLGYISGYDAWNVQMMWTWLRFTAHKKVAFHPSIFALEGLIPQEDFSIDPDATTEFFQFAGGRWRLNYNIGDLQLARGFFITKALSIAPLIGIRTGLLYQKSSCYFLNPVVSSPSFVWATKLVVHDNYCGAGPRLGIDGKWTFPYNVGFTGLISGSILYGKMKQSMTWYETFTTAGLLEESGKQTDSFNAIVPNVQLALGVDWGFAFDKSRRYFGMNLGWEFNYWWQPVPFDKERTHPSPLEIQGLTFRTDLHF